MRSGLGLQLPPASNGASSTATTICTTSTTGKTRTAERLCKAVISLSRPTPAAAAVAPSHNAATTHAPVGYAVGHELRAKSGPGIGQPGAEGDQRVEAAMAAQRVRGKRHGAERAHAERQRKRRGVGAALPRRPHHEPADPRDDRDGRDHLPAARGLAEEADADNQQRKDADRERRLDDRDRDQRQRRGLHGPASEHTARAAEPARAGGQALDE